tara:strand:- start:1756 stop:2340 length:585 start_codon:yes stop_codon:yes gene_type:complete
MTSKKAPNYTVIKDTREQDGWFFTSYDRCEGMEVNTLHTGDYTLKGFEDVICVERKASVSEIATNLGKKKKAFYNEMERMRDFNFRYLLLEFSALDVIDYPLSLLGEGDQELYKLYKSGEIDLPDFKRFRIVEQTKISGKYLIKSLMELGIRYDINVMFCGSKNGAFLICNSLFKRLNELFYEEDKDDYEKQAT